MKIREEDFEDCYSALLSAYPNRNALTRMLRFGMRERLDDIVGRGNMRDTVFELLEWAETQGRAEELLAAAHKRNQGNPDLKAFILAASVGSTPNVGSDLEALVLENVEFENIATFQDGLARSANPVCRVECPPQMGTGFLVADDLVLTNHHVVRHLDANSPTGDDVLVRFDFKTDVAGVGTSAGQAFRLCADWLVDHSPADELDFALLKLDGNAAGANAADGKARGSLTPVEHTFTPGEPLFIIQHPEAEPLKLTAGSVTDFDPAGSAPRVRYNTNTLPGSSGSPCFNLKWELVALHHAGKKATGNAGIPFGASHPLLSRTT